MADRTRSTSLMLTAVAAFLLGALAFGLLDGRIAPDETLTIEGASQVRGI